MITLAQRHTEVDPVWKKFGDWIAEKQNSVHPVISDRELARRSGLSNTFIGYLKKGTTSTGPEQIIAISHALGATEQEAFMILGMNVPGIPVEAVEFAGMLHGLDDDRKRMLMHLTRAAREALEMSAV